MVQILVLFVALSAAACSGAEESCVGPSCQQPHDDLVSMLQMRLGTQNVEQRGIDIALGLHHPPRVVRYSPSASQRAIERATVGTCPLKASVSSPSGVPQPSPGCYKRAPIRKTGVQDITVWDPGLGKNVKRQYDIAVPALADKASAGQPAPLMFWLHGQGGDMYEQERWAEASGIAPCAHAQGYITVYPQGTSYDADSKATGPVDNPMNYASYDQGTGWNVGSGGNDDVCITPDDLIGPLAGIGATDYSCYPSCIKQGKCGRCNWSTCLDDVAFVQTMLASFSEDYCIDMSRIFFGGQSNGGMMTHYISQTLPGVFAGFNPLYGLPLAGYASGANGQLIRHQVELEESAIVEFHDRQDRTIPINGGLAPSQGWTWYYESLTVMMSLWAAVNSCDTQDTDVTTLVKQVCPLSEDVRCYEHLQCKTQRRVIKCLYDGSHGSMISSSAFGCVSVWFFNQFRRTTKP